MKIYFRCSIDSNGYPFHLPMLFSGGKKYVTSYKVKLIHNYSKGRNNKKIKDFRFNFTALKYEFEIRFRIS